ncbi:MAG: hypothetical protein Roseis2KO_56060 [Roseivirga sp.]
MAGMQASEFGKEVIEFKKGSIVNSLLTILKTLITHRLYIFCKFRTATYDVIRNEALIAQNNSLHLLRH